MSTDKKKSKPIVVFFNQKLQKEHDLNQRNAYPPWAKLYVIQDVIFFCLHDVKC